MYIYFFNNKIMKMTFNKISCIIFFALMLTTTLILCKKLKSKKANYSKNIYLIISI